MIRRSCKIIVCVGAIFQLAACATIYTARGAYHRVQPNDTLALIAKKYHASLQDVAELNNIDSPEDLKVGRSIYIPGVKVSGGGLFPIIAEKSRESGSPKEVETRPSKKTGKPETRESGKGAQPETKGEGEIYVNHSRFRWPIEGQISSLFGVRHGRRHDGLDIRSPQGTAIHAAAEGEVVYAQRMRGYGNLILIKHPDNLFTIYAHNQSNLAKKGSKVKAGEVIAKVGRTGKATGPHLHFEVRDGRQPRNPLFFLPKNQYALSAKARGDNAVIPDH